MDELVGASAAAVDPGGDPIPEGAVGLRGHEVRRVEAEARGVAHDVGRDGQLVRTCVPL